MDPRVRAPPRLSTEGVGDDDDVAAGAETEAEVDMDEQGVAEVTRVDDEQSSCDTGGGGGGGEQEVEGEENIRHT